jgi:hypothetical protein
MKLELCAEREADECLEELGDDLPRIEAEEVKYL